MSPKHPTKEQINQAVNWLDEGGEAARAFKLSLEAGGVIVEDVMRVVAAVDGLLTCGLERDAIVALIEMKTPRAANGTRISSETIDRVLTGLGRLKDHLTPAKQAAVPKVTTIVETLTPEEAAALRALRERKK